MKKNSKIYVAGHTGLVGSAFLKKLKDNGYTNILIKTHKELNLLNQQNVIDFFKKEKPEYVFIAAAKVGGIIANNTYRGQFIYENLQIQNNIIHESYKNNVKKLIFLGSSCIYPKNSPQPIKEDYLLTNELEYTNEPYAIAKIAGMKMCENYNYQYNTNFISIMPTNLYGENDNYDLKNSHVLAALIRKIHLAKCLENGDIDTIKNDLNKRPINNVDGTSDYDTIINILNDNGIINKKPIIVKLWGSGKPKREFLHSSDMADACLYIMENINFNNLRKNKIKNTHINIGTGEDISIKELANLIKNIIGFDGNIEFDKTMPDGMYRKLLDVSKIKSYGWENKINLKEGIESIYKKYKQ